MPGFYPGSGTLSDLGFSKGKYYSLNVPFSEGVSDNTLLYTFNKIFPRYNKICTISMLYAKLIIVIE